MKKAKDKSARPTSVAIQPDVRALLDKWAAQHMTSMAAEIARSVRERAQRERQEAAA